MKKERQRQKQVIYDTFGNLVEIGKLPTAPSDKERNGIRRILRLMYETKFPRCKFRAKVRAWALDKGLGFTEDQIKANLGVHTKRDHVCSECRCKNIAGFRSRGWWYWPKDNPRGYGEVGHYGVGPCFEHGPFNRERFSGDSLTGYSSMIEAEIEAMQQHGAAPDASGTWLVSVKDNADAADARNDINACRMAAKRTMEDLVRRLDSGQVLTEKMGSGDGPMTDKTIFELKMKAAQIVALLAEKELENDPQNYAHRTEVDQLLTRILMVVESRYRPKGGAEEWNEFVADVRDVCRGIRYGKQ